MASKISAFESLRVLTLPDVRVAFWIELNLWMISSPSGPLIRKWSAGVVSQEEGDLGLAATFLNLCAYQAN
jgi:hypothetical protein